MDFAEGRTYEQRLIDADKRDVRPLPPSLIVILASGRREYERQTCTSTNVAAVDYDILPLHAVQ